MQSSERSQTDSLSEIFKKAQSYEKSQRPYVLESGFLTGILAIAVLSTIGALFIGRGFGDWDLGFGLAGICLGVSVLLLAYEITKRGKKGRYTRQGHALLSDALDATANGRAVTGLNGDLVYANKAYRALMCDADGVVLSPAEWAKIENSGQEKTSELLQKMQQGMPRAETDVQLRLSDGLRHSVRVSVQQAQNETPYLYWQIRDLSSATARESVPAYSRSQSVTLGDINAANAGYLQVSAENKIVKVNQFLAEALGRRESELIGRPIAAFVDNVGVIGEKTLQGMATVSGSVRIFFMQPVFFTEASAEGARDFVLFPVHNAEDGAFIAAERGEIELAGEFEQHFRDFFMHAPVGIALVSADGNILEYNRQFSGFMKGLEPTMVTSLTELLMDEEAKDVAVLLSSLGEGEIEASGAVDVRFKGDADRRAQLYINSVGRCYKDVGQVAVLYLIDTTDQKNLELQFAQSQKMQAVGQLAGGIAHDFNNLLTAITGFCDLLLVRHGPGDHSFADIIQIKQNANRAANLVRQLLAFSRQQTLRPKVLIVTDVLAELSNLLRRLIGENIELIMNHGRNLGPVKVDQGQLEQVIINLAVNARDAMGDGGTLTIRTENISREESAELSQRYSFMPANDYILLEVSDTGSGIAAENIGKIFEPFFSTKEVGKGTGLGLSTVYGIVKQTGGFIFPDSIVNQGTTFRIYLPVYEENQQGSPEEEMAEAEKIQQEAEAPAVRDLTGKGTILLVEDEDAVRMFASRALKNKGYNVLEADSGETALEVVNAHSDEIDLLVSDVVMPQMDGPTLVKEIRKRRYDMKIIFISGYAEDAFRKNLGDEENFSFLPKPFSLKQLAETVKEVLGD
ncbi:MAG: hybrid sensor histidine kinase/response regulator [Kordiimonas sp.]|nr:hybrid sensor histidine kinase/response regulator [Kordiimonas sp.]